MSRITPNTMLALARAVIVAAAVVIAGCAVGLPPHPREAEAKQFQPVPDKAVIYIGRTYPGPAYSSPVMLDNRMMGSLYSGTFFRWEVDPGQHRIAGFAADNALLQIDAGAGQIYFVEQVPFGLRSFSFSMLRLLDPNSGRLLVANARLQATN